MSIINKGTSFANGEQLTADKINDLIDLATFNQDATDSQTTDVNSAGQIRVNAGGIDTAQLATDAVETAKIKDANVTFAKLADVLDENDMSSDSDTSLATQQSIKAYVTAMRPKFVSLTGGTTALSKTTTSISSVGYTYNIADFTSSDSDFGTSKIVALIIGGFTSSSANLNSVQVRLPNGDFTVIGATSADSTADFTQDNATSNIPINSGQSSIVIKHVVGDAQTSAAVSTIKGAIIHPGL